MNLGEWIRGWELAWISLLVTGPEWTADGMGEVVFLGLGITGLVCLEVGGMRGMWWTQPGLRCCLKPGPVFSGGGPCKEPTGSYLSRSACRKHLRRLPSGERRGCRAASACLAVVWFSLTGSLFPVNPEPRGSCLGSLCAAWSPSLVKSTPLQYYLSVNLSKLLYSPLLSSPPRNFPWSFLPAVLHLTECPHPLSH